MNGLSQVLRKRINMAEHLAFLTNARALDMIELIDAVLEVSKPLRGSRPYFEFYWKMHLMKQPLPLVRAIYLVTHYWKSLDGFFSNEKDREEIIALISVLVALEGGNGDFDLSNTDGIIEGLPA